MTEIKDRVLTKLQGELKEFKNWQIEKVLDMLEEGNTVPFIARYRKEATGALDEVQIKEIQDSQVRVMNLENRKDEVLASIASQDKLTPQLEEEILAADQLQKVEDLYLPYKRKRRTKAVMARESGLQPLADWLRSYPDQADLDSEAEKYISEEYGITSSEEALDGAFEIIAEEIGDRADFRETVRQRTAKDGKLVSKLKKEAVDERNVYKEYYENEDKISHIRSHRVLAMNRGEKEGVLSVSVQTDDEAIIDQLVNRSIPAGKGTLPAAEWVEKAIIDGYKRFIKPAVEREIRNQLTEAAEEQAIAVFAENLTHLLLQAPLKDQVILGFDPAFRSGCKLAVIDRTGKLLAVDIIYPHAKGHSAQKAAGSRLLEMIEEFKVDTIAIGNGTASRESEQFVAETIQSLDRQVAYVIVNEAGASVYSASEEARREFPDLQVEERSAVSIARRLQDPLAELVKIDPQSLGVGQYQHDVSQKELTQALDFVIETSVNRVGVNVNTASRALLQHVSGLNKTTAQNFIDHREEQGVFTNRKQFKQVARVGAKTYEQAVGFLRIPNGDNPLDNTGIHPETYKEARQIMEMAGISMDDIGTQEVKSSILDLNPEEVKEETELGSETMKDIITSLINPGRDMRDEMEGPALRTDVLSIEDIQAGMQLEGVVRNVVDFGAFVDIGVGQDGLVHISKLSPQFVTHPSDMVAVGDIVDVWVEDVDLDRQRIQLSMIPL